MDFLNKFSDKSGSQQNAEGQTGQQNSVGGFMGKINNAMGGGEAGERNEDSPDKALDFVQERILKQGSQYNESAAEQMKDEAMSDTIRAQYKSMTGKDFPFADKS